MGSMRAIVVLVCVLTCGAAASAVAATPVTSAELAELRGGCEPCAGGGKKWRCPDDVQCHAGPLCSTVPQACVLCGGGWFIWWNKRCACDVFGSFNHCRKIVDTNPGCGKQINGNCITITTGFSCDVSGNPWTQTSCGSRDDCQLYN